MRSAKIAPGSNRLMLAPPRWKFAQHTTSRRTGAV
jgi:hypothetical protein